MPRPIKVIVGPAGSDASWSLTVEGEPRPAETFGTKPAAVTAGRALLEELGGGELETRRRDGTIEEARTIGVAENRRSPG